MREWERSRGRERERSRERVDPLPTAERVVMEQNKKKVREDDGEFSKSQLLIPRVEDWMKENGEEKDSKTTKDDAKKKKENVVEESKNDDRRMEGSGSGSKWSSFKVAVLNENSSVVEEEED